MCFAGYCPNVSFNGNNNDVIVFCDDGVNGNSVGVRMGCADFALIVAAKTAHVGPTSCHHVTQMTSR